MRMRFVVYRDIEGRFRWSLYSDEGPRIAQGVDGHATSKECFDAILQVRNSRYAEVDDQTLVEAGDLRGHD
jgi:uncharacterized protein YegP (UPF0339 family)